MSVIQHLGRRKPTTWTHVEKHPLLLSNAPDKPVPITVGVNWYNNFDTPVQDKDGTWWVGRGNLGHIRGGHCICMPHNYKKDTKAMWRFYNQGAEGACFLPDTLITMADGSTKRIDEVKLLDTVITAEGNYEMVMEKMARFHTEGMIKLSLYGHNHLKATPEHPILTKRGYVALKDITLEDYVCLTKPRVENIQNEISLEEIVQENESKGKYGEMSFGGVKVRVNVLPKTLVLNYNLGNLFGLFSAEGGTTSNRVYFTFAGKERNTLVQKTVDLIKSELGIDAHIQKRPSGVYNVVIYGKLWRLLFERLITGNCWNKHLSSYLTSGNNEFKSGILNGWLEGDGHSRRKQREGITVSRELALDMFNIANGLDLYPAINVSAPSVNKHAKTRALRWQVTIRDERANHFTVIEDDKCMWRKVRSIEKEDFVGYVFNMEVANDNSYIAEGVGVHNCVGFGSSRMMTLLNKNTRYDARWLWGEAKEIDEWEDTHKGDDNGTSVRAAMDILRTIGHKKATAKKPKTTEGIIANKWATNIEDLFSVLQNEEYEKKSAIPFLNSWGEEYPHVVWMPCETWDRLIKEDGEFTLITDKP